MEALIQCSADRRAENAQLAVSCTQNRGKRSRANSQERLQNYASGTAGTATPQIAGCGVVHRQPGGQILHVPLSGCFFRKKENFVSEHTTATKMSAKPMSRGTVTGSP